MRPSAKRRMSDFTRTRNACGIANRSRSACWARTISSGFGAALMRKELAPTDYSPRADIRFRLGDQSAELGAIFKRELLNAVFGQRNERSRRPAVVRHDDWLSRTDTPQELVGVVLEFDGIHRFHHIS